MNQHRSKRAWRLWAKRCAFGLLVTTTLVGGWRAVAVILGEELRQATVEANDICERLAKQRFCPSSLPTERAIDPWGRPYRCRVVTSGLAIGSYGADGKPLGSGRDGDVECMPSSDTSSCSCDLAVSSK
ncbi:MAG: hypothetical protein RL701_2967 [Pseudomonadota bacterium]